MDNYLDVFTRQICVDDEIAGSVLGEKSRIAAAPLAGKAGRMADRRINLYDDLEKMFPQLKRFARQKNTEAALSPEKNDASFDTRGRTSLASTVETMTETITTETVVGLTARAAAECKSLLALPENAGKNFRVYVEQGGCSGMQYGMVFDEKRDGDLASRTAWRDGFGGRRSARNICAARWWISATR